MCQLAVQESEWIQVSGWEGAQSTWSRTAASLCAHRHLLSDAGFPAARILLLCGADLLNAFYDEQVWPPDQVDEILRDYGVAVAERAGTDLDAILEGHAVLRRHRQNVIHIAPTVINNISSTLVRDLITQHRSIKYLTPDAVIGYIQAESLY